MKLKSLALLLMTIAMPAMAEQVSVNSKGISLILDVENGKPAQYLYFGSKLNAADLQNLTVATNGRMDAYPAYGLNTPVEAALAMRHSDGNLSTALVATGSDVKQEANATVTTIHLKDPVYNIKVDLKYRAYKDVDMIEAWTEINNGEKGTVTLTTFASAMLPIRRGDVWMSHLSGTWAAEAQLSHEKLQPGEFVIRNNDGVRNSHTDHAEVMFSLNGKGQENTGAVIGAALAYSGNYKLKTVTDDTEYHYFFAGINEQNSEYHLKKGETFKTPALALTYSNEGLSGASRNFHKWGRKYVLAHGDQERDILLNSWEGVYFDINQKGMDQMMADIHSMGGELFVMDDGWFGKKYPRKRDNTALGDWVVDTEKLPDGIEGLLRDAKKNGVKFGIWIEPEMVNPKSELFEKHPDWAITLPNRKTYYYRNQLVLDLSNPKVQDFVFGVVDNILTENPEVAYFKWDCNSPITNVYSPYLKNKQGQLYIDHVRGIYNVLKRVKEKYPNTPMMLCSGGGARCDYEALKYFTEFWCSDNTDPIERLFIQWGFSQIFPSKAMSAHVTSWNKKTSVKFRTDVASMCKLGFDLGLKELNADELTYCQNAVANWTRLKKVILDGDQYRLVSPYDGNHMSVMYTAPDKNKAVLYTYDIHPRYAEKLLPVKLQGLDPSKRYKVKEINLMPNKKSNLGANEKTYSGDYLMKIGINAFTTNQAFSRVIELTAE